jgi:hypothetical protein
MISISDGSSAIVSFTKVFSGSGVFIAFIFITGLTGAPIDIPSAVSFLDGLITTSFVHGLNHVSSATISNMIVPCVSFGNAAFKLRMGTLQFPSESIDPLNDTL